jgi:hypothetical protein
MGQNLPLCAQLGATRSRQDESHEVHDAGRIRRPAGGSGGAACPCAAPPDMAVGRGGLHCTRIRQPTCGYGVVHSAFDSEQSKKCPPVGAHPAAPLRL